MQEFPCVVPRKLVAHRVVRIRSELMPLNDARFDTGSIGRRGLEALRENDAECDKPRIVRVLACQGQEADPAHLHLRCRAEDALLLVLLRAPLRLAENDGSVAVQREVGFGAMTRLARLRMRQASPET